MRGIKASDDDREFDQFKTGRELVSRKPAGGSGSSEYGGVEGMIQPPPHDVMSGSEYAHEQLKLVYATDPAERVITPLTIEEPQLIRKYTG